MLRFEQQFFEQTGRKVLTLITPPACGPDDPLADTVGRIAGFSLKVVQGAPVRSISVTILCKIQLLI